MSNERTQGLGWVALLGRRDTPTDGVADYCNFLGQALEADGIELKKVRGDWAEKGWIAALLQLSHEAVTWRGKWVLLQYTALEWSRRGFPIGVLIMLAILQRCGVRCAIVFHEPYRQGGSRPMDRLRGVCQDWVIQRLYRNAAKSIFTVPLETIPWLPRVTKKAAFIPIGANIPERVRRRALPVHEGKQKTVIVFGVTDSREAAEQEVTDILGIMLEACKALGKLRLVVVGRGAAEAGDLFAKAFHGHDVDLIVRGVLPAEEIADEVESADALLFVRGAITSRRGSALAGIACGIPIVGYRVEGVSDPLEAAGVEWSPWRDREGLARGLIRVLSDPQRWRELHQRNLEVQNNYLSWNRIAERFRAELVG
jgi:glycosyltransferase involved in cell wall biosynthesis